MKASSIQEFLSAPYRNFLLLWTPVLFSLLAEPLTGLVDTACISRLGAEALSALGAGTVILTSGLWVFNFLSVGSQTEISHAQGSDNLLQGRRIGSLALVTAAAIGLVMAAITWHYAELLAALMGTEGTVLRHASTYIHIRALGAPSVLLTMTAVGILYGLGDMRSPFSIAVAVNALNIILDWLLIFGPGPFPAMGIAGAALASVISQAMGAAWAVFLVYRELGFTRAIRVGDITRLLQIGRDMFIRTGTLILFLLLATRMATLLGANVGAAHQAVRQVWVFTNLFLDASAITAQSVVGFFFGSGQRWQARQVARFVTMQSLLVGTLLMGAMLTGSSGAAVLFVPPSGLDYFYPAWTIAAMLQPIAAMAFITDGIHWGTGDFPFLRNGVLVATVFAAAVLWLMHLTSTTTLEYIWVTIGAWIAIRACLGILRIWPGIRNSPLQLNPPARSN